MGHQRFVSVDLDELEDGGVELVDEDGAGVALHFGSEGCQRDESYLFFLLVIGLGDEFDNPGEDLHEKSATP